jgi:hypothetical protein
MKSSAASRDEKQAARLARTADLLLRLHLKGPTQVLAELRWVQEERHYKRGWTAHCFRELFGMWPRGEVEPARPTDKKLFAGRYEMTAAARCILTLLWGVPQGQTQSERPKRGDRASASRS